MSINKVLLYFTFFLPFSCQGQENGAFKEKINGLSFVASRNHVDSETIKPVIAVNANWVTLMPFAFMEKANAPTFRFKHKRQWWGEKIEGVKEASNVFTNENIKRMLKPQIWVRGGSFTGHIKMQSEADWLLFEKEYEQFILTYAKVAADEKFELFCIGTELNNFIVTRQYFWKALIIKIRKIYKGKLTYAANWDSYQNPEFWEQLDLIGIDAYFPLSENKTPTIEELNTAWIPLKKEIHDFSIDNQKPILFTEFGYRNIDYTARQPWDSNLVGIYNIEAQQNALTSIFETFWKEDWFKGGFLWKWFDNYTNAGGKNHTGFTVQNKKSENIITNFYKHQSLIND